MTKGVWILAAFGTGCVATGARADVTYEGQTRSMTVRANLTELHEESSQLGTFNSELHAFHPHEHGQYSSADGRLDSSIEAGSITMSDRFAATDAFSQGGSGGGYGTAVLDVTFRVATTQRYDFVVSTTMTANGPWYDVLHRASLTGVGGTVFEMDPFPFESTQRFGGVLSAGLYHLHLEHHFGYGGSSIGHGEGTYYANLTVPAPATLSLLGAAALGGLRRRR